jgi:hypothetical protein
VGREAIASSVGQRKRCVRPIVFVASGLCHNTGEDGYVGPQHLQPA